MVDEWPYVIRMYLPVKSWFLLRLAETDRDRFKAEFGIKRFPSFASWYYKVSTIQFWRENIRDKWCRLSRNIYSRTLSLKEQGLLCSKDLNCS